jgi:hypothetical protein
MKSFKDFLKENVSDDSWVKKVIAKIVSKNESNGHIPAQAFPHLKGTNPGADAKVEKQEKAALAPCPENPAGRDAQKTNDKAPLPTKDKKTLADIGLCYKNLNS